MLINYPRQFSNWAIAIYFALLVVLGFVFSQHVMAWYFYAIGITAVLCFFVYSRRLPKDWQRLSDKRFEKKLFWTAFAIRSVYVIAVFIFYRIVTDTDFDFEGGDVGFYHYSAVGLHDLYRQGHFTEVVPFLFQGDYGDMGYPFYLSLIYTLTRDSIIAPRLVKAVLGSFMCVLIYRLASRNFGQETGRLAAVMSLLMPNFIYYCGSHLKECEMVFLVVLFAERADNMFRAPRVKVMQIVGVLFLAFLLFFLRTALAVILIISLAMTAFFNSSRVVGWGQKVVVILFVVLTVIILSGTGFNRDVVHEWNRRDEQKSNMEWRAERNNGNIYAIYGSRAVFAPLIFTIPFPTMVNVEGQEHTQMCHGGNYVKNIISIFALLALLSMLLSGNWRDHVLILSILLGYLAVLALSQFAQSERFHMPALPFIVIMAAYGITHLKPGQVSIAKLWFLAMFAAGIGWNYIKLKGRGLI